MSGGAIIRLISATRFERSGLFRQASVGAVAGLPQQFLGPLRVVRERFEVLSETEAARQERRGQPVGVALVDVLQDAVPVDRVVERQADVAVVERRYAVVQLHLGRAGAQAGVHAYAGDAVDAVDEVRRNGVDDVNLTGQQGGDAGRGFGHHAEHDRLQGRRAGPVTVVALQADLGVKLALHPAERAAADGLLHERRYSDLFEVVLGNDLEVGQALQHKSLREGLLVDEADGVVIDLLDVAERPNQAGTRTRLTVDAPFGQDAVEGEHDVISGQRLTVVEGHAFTQVELEGQVVDGAPVSGEHRFDLAIRQAFGQRVEDVAQHRFGVPVTVHGRVGRDEGIGPQGDDNAVGAVDGNLVHAGAVVSSRTPVLQVIPG